MTVFLLCVYGLLYYDVTDNYVLAGILLFITYHVSSATFYTIEAYLVSDALKSRGVRFTCCSALDLGSKFWIYALTGLRIRFDQPYIFFMSLFDMSPYTVLMSIYFSAGMYFILNVLASNQHTPVITGVLNFSGILQTAACDIFTIFDFIGEEFFSIYGNDDLLAPLLYLNIYFKMQSIANQVRNLAVWVLPDLSIACNGEMVSVAFTDDLVARVASVVFSAMTLMIPFSLFRDARYFFNNFYLWLINTAAIALCCVSLIYRNDLVPAFANLVLPDASYTRTITSHGWDIITTLSVMGVCSFLLALPSQRLALLDYRQQQIEEQAIRDGGDLTLCHALKNKFDVYYLVPVRFLLSEAFIFSFVTMIYFFVVVEMGLPMTHITPYQFTNQTVYPAYMAETSFEVALYGSCIPANGVEACVENTVETVLDKITLDIGKTAATLFSIIPSVSIAGVTIGIGSILADGANDLATLLVSAENLAINEIFSLLNLVIQQLDALLADLIGPLEQFAYGVFEYAIQEADLLDYFFRWIPSSLSVGGFTLTTKYIPVIIFVLVLVAVFAGIYIPAMSNTFQMSFLLCLVLFVLGGYYMWLFLEYFLVQYSVTIDIQWNMTIVYYDISCVLAVVISMFMFMTFTAEDALKVDPVFDELVANFMLDYHPRRQLARKHNNEIDMIQLPPDAMFEHALSKMVEEYNEKLDWNQDHSQEVPPEVLAKHQIFDQLITGFRRAYYTKQLELASSTALVIHSQSGGGGGLTYPQKGVLLTRDPHPAETVRLMKTCSPTEYNQDIISDDNNNEDELEGVPLMSTKLQQPVTQLVHTKKRIKHFLT